MFKILFIDIYDNNKILLTVQNINDSEVIRVLVKRKHLEKADKFKFSNKLIVFDCIIKSNRETYKSVDFY